MFKYFDWPINLQQRFMTLIFFWRWLTNSSTDISRGHPFRLLRQPIRNRDVRRASSLCCACASRRHFVSTGLTAILSAGAADLYSSKKPRILLIFSNKLLVSIFKREIFSPYFLFFSDFEPSLDFFFFFFKFLNVFTPLAGVPVGISGVHFVMAAQ